MRIAIKTVHAFAISAGMLLLFSCSDTAEDKQDRMQDRMQNIHEDMNEVETAEREDFEDDRQDILGDLRDLRADINDDLSDSQEELAKADLDQEERNKHMRLTNELQRHRDVVETYIDKVEKADMHQWESVQIEARNALQDAELFYGRENMERRRGVTGGAGHYEDREVRGDGTVNTDRNLDLNRNADAVRDGSEQ